MTAPEITDYEVCALRSVGLMRSERVRSERGFIGAVVNIM